MKSWREPGFLLPLLIALVWGLWILGFHQDTMREKAFTLMMFVGLASSLNILLGYTYVSFGHIVFFGLGGYTGFYFLSEQGWPLVASALMGGLLSSIIAGLVGLAVLRLRGAYFALATIGINEAARAFVSNFEPFGGATGLSLNFSVYQKYGGAAKALCTTFTWLWITVLIILVISYLVKRSRFGLGLLAIREDEDAAMVLGVKAPQVKTMAYIISAFFPGVIGTLYFFKNGNIEPGDAFQLHMSIEMLVMVMCSLLFVVALLRRAIPIQGWRDGCSRILHTIGQSWIACNSLGLAWTKKIHWDVEGTDGLRRNAWYLVVANHQTWVDIVVLQKVFYGKIPMLEFFLNKN